MIISRILNIIGLIIISSGGYIVLFQLYAMFRGQKRKAEIIGYMPHAELFGRYSLTCCVMFTDDDSQEIKSESVHGVKNGKGTPPLDFSDMPFGETEIYYMPESGKCVLDSFMWKLIARGGIYIAVGIMICFMAALISKHI